MEKKLTDLRKEHANAEHDLLLKLFAGILAHLLDDDDRLEEIWNSEHSLKELVSPDKFKSYEDLKAKLDRVLGLGTTTDKSSDVPFDGGEPYTPPPKPVESVTAESDDGDESMDYFQKLAQEA